ncbi:MAG: A/G-specific adenine glycosylase [Bacteroidetes bacterium]|nr:MAG: A/G-specific adenine glycosylase [Bacteroidota bacterium]
MNFSDRILSWYHIHKRELPWRETRDPYRVWLSEIMLQQTRVAQGLPYYIKFTERFPKVEDLAAASEEEVLKLWQGLGYYSRARNLHATSRAVSSEYGGHFPDSYRELLKLKGIGPYTAAAIASICYSLPHPVVDGNVYRVLSRFFGVQLPINSTEGIRYFSDLAAEVIDMERPGEYNQGLMEFGALQCVPQNPDCQACPLSGSCEAFARGLVSVLPRKLPKKKVRERIFNYLMPVDPNFQTRLTKRKDKGIWQGLFEFPLIETPEEVSDAKIRDLIKTVGSEDLSDPQSVVRFNAKPLVHKLSHQHLHVTFWILHLEDPLDHSVSISEMHSYPVPVLIISWKPLKIRTFDLIQIL